LHWEARLTLEQYVARQAWRTATLAKCPKHPEGGCGLCRWGTYMRKVPVVCWIARFYCPTDRQTFSLLPDLLAARMPGTLEQVQQAAEAIDGFGQGKVVLEQAADALRPPAEQRQAVELRSVVEWMKRRHRAVAAALAVVIVGLPGLFEGCCATIESLAQRLGTAAVLTALRQLAAWQRVEIPAPIGLGPRGGGYQQSMRNRR
jgi:hypothetical protein